MAVAGPFEGYAGDVIDEDGETVRAALLLFGRPEILEFATVDLAEEAEPNEAGVRRWARQSFDRWIAAKLVSYWEGESDLSSSERYHGAMRLRRDLEDRLRPEIDAFTAEISHAIKSRPDEAVEVTFMRYSERWLRREEDASEVFVSLHTDDRRWLTLDSTVATCANAAGVPHRARAEATDGEEVRSLFATLEHWKEAASVLRTAHLRVLHSRARRPKPRP